MSNLIERLRDLANLRHDDLSIGDEAADRIEELEADLLDTDNRRRVLSAQVVQLEAENEGLRKEVEFLRLIQES